MAHHETLQFCNVFILLSTFGFVDHHRNCITTCRGVRRLCVGVSRVKEIAWNTRINWQGLRRLFGIGSMGTNAGPLGRNKK